MKNTLKRKAGSTPTTVGRFVRAGGWWLATAPIAPRAIEIGAPGLWKAGRDRETMIFSVPESCLPGELDPAEGVLPVWARASARGKVPAGWRPPAREDLDEWLPAGARTIRHDEVIRQLDILLQPDRLAIRMPLVALPDGLPEVRSCWLDRILADAAATWRMVRLGRLEASECSRIAEIDLTGAPAAMLPALLRSARDTLHWLAGAVLETAEFISRADTESEALKHFPPG